MISLKLPKKVADYRKKLSDYQLNATSLKILFTEFKKIEPELYDDLFSADGTLLPFVTLCVDSQVVEFEDYIELRENSKVILISAVAGG